MRRVIPRRTATRRRGQVAMEFIATYGWALLVLLGMISALSYFGFMNPSKVLPSKCTLGTELQCVDYQILEDGTLNLIMKQGLGKTIYVSSVRCMYEGNEDLVTYDDPGDPWSPRDQREESCAAVPLSGLRGEKVKVYFEITFRKSPAGFEHLVAGEVYSTVQ